MLLWPTIVYGPSRMGVEPIGLGSIIVSNIFGHVVNQCDVNQSRGYWVLFDALVVISLVVKMQVQGWHLILWKLKILIQNFKFCNNMCKSKW